MTAYEIQDGTLREVADPPTRADLVQVVRCRDCRALDQIDIDWRDWCFCRNFREYVEPNGFCAWGERRNA